MLGPVSMNMPATIQIARKSKMTVLRSVPKPITQATKSCGTLSTVSACEKSRATAMMGSTTPHTRADVPSMAGKSASLSRPCARPVPTATATATAADSVGVKTPL